MNNLETYLIGGFVFCIAIFLRFKWQKKLEEELREVGVEVSANVDQRRKVRRGSILYVSFILHGQVIKKRVRCVELGEKPLYPMVVNPQNSDRYLFNTKKSDLIPSGHDSVQNFLKGQ